MIPQPDFARQDVDAAVLERLESVRTVDDRLQARSTGPSSSSSCYHLRAQQVCLRLRPRSSRGLGRRPLTAVARVRIPYAVPQESPAPAGFFCALVRQCSWPGAARNGHRRPRLPQDCHKNPRHRGPATPNPRVDSRGSRHPRGFGFASAWYLSASRDSPRGRAWCPRPRYGRSAWTSNPRRASHTRGFSAGSANRTVRECPLRFVLHSRVVSEPRRLAPSRTFAGARIRTWSGNTGNIGLVVVFVRRVARLRQRAPSPTASRSRS